MPRHIHTATGPNGEKFKRTSASRRYNFVAIARTSYEHAIRRAHETVAWDIKNYNEHVVNARDGYKPAQWMLNNTNRDGQNTAAAFRQKGKEDSTRWLADKPATAKEYADQKLAAALAEIEESKAAGRYSTFFAVSWSGTRHNAEKSLAAAYGVYDGRVIAVDPVA